MAKKRLLNTLFLLSPIFNISAGFSSCVSAKMNVFAPKITNYSIYVDEQNKGNVIINGFRFTGNIVNPDWLFVEQSFSKGLNKFSASIIELNTEQQTFSVLLTVTNAFCGDFDGSFTFRYEDKMIDDIKTNFTISIKKPPQILAPQEPLDTSVIKNLPEEQYTEVKLNDFDTNNIDDVNDIKVTSTFGDEQTSFETTIEKGEQGSFNVDIKIFNPQPIIYWGYLTFSYDVEGIETVLLQTKQFYIDVLPERSIIAPKYDEQSVTIERTVGKVVFEGFHYQTIESKDEISVDLSFASTHFPGDYQAQIIDWNPYLKTFSIELSFTNMVCTNEEIEFNFIFNGEPAISYSIENYKLKFLFPFPTEYMYFSVNPETGFQNLYDFEWPPTGSYNVFVVPEMVEEISFNSPGRFRRGTPFELDLSKARNLKRIGPNAFNRAEDMVGQLVFSPNLVDIGSGAFQMCTNVHIMDLTQFTELPKWPKDSYIFESIGGNDGGYAFVSCLRTEWMTFLYDRGCYWNVIKV